MHLFRITAPTLLRPLYHLRSDPELSAAETVAREMHPADHTVTHLATYPSKAEDPEAVRRWVGEQIEADKVLTR